MARTRDARVRKGGCFVCGGEDHWDTSHCPIVKAGKFNKQAFFRELWAHKPWLKRAPTPPTSTALATCHQYSHYQNPNHYDGNNSAAYNFNPDYKSIQNNNSNTVI